MRFWGCLLLQHNLTYTEVCHSSKDLGLDVCNVLCSILILPLLPLELVEKQSELKTRGKWWQEAHRRKTNRRLFFKNTGIKPRCKLQNVRSQTVTSSSNACAFLKQNQGLLNGGQSCSKCLHCTSYTLFILYGFPFLSGSNF